MKELLILIRTINFFNINDERFLNYQNQNEKKINEGHNNFFGNIIFNTTVNLFYIKVNNLVD